MGILERLEEMLTELLAIYDSGLVLDALRVTDTETNETEEIVNEMRDNGGEGVIWDERIHTTNKARTQKDLWKRKHGLDTDFYNSVMAELQGESTKKAPPSKKSPPVKKTPPGKTTDQKFKQEALKNINMICKRHDVSFEMVVANILEKHGLNTFDGLPENLHEEVSEKTSIWLEKLNKVQEEIDVLNKMSDGSEHNQDINDAILVYIQEAGASDSALGSVPIDSLEGLRLELIGYSNQWAEFFRE